MQAAESQFLNQFLSALIVIVLGSNGVLAALLYWLNTRSKTRLIEAQSIADARAKRLEMQLKQNEARHEREMSDEKQTDKIVTLPSDLINLIGRLQTQLSREQEARAENERKRELDYEVLKGLYDRSVKEMQGLVEGQETRLKKAIYSELQAAIEENQRQTMQREGAKDFAQEYRFPVENDPRWKLCSLTIESGDSVMVYKSPLTVNDNKLWQLVEKDMQKIWIIEETLSHLSGWCMVRLIDMPEVKGFIRAYRIKISACGTPEIKPVLPLPA